MTALNEGQKDRLPQMTFFVVCFSIRNDVLAKTLLCGMWVVFNLIMKAIKISYFKHYGNKLIFCGGNRSKSLSNTMAKQNYLIKVVF